MDETERIKKLEEMHRFYSEEAIPCAICATAGVIKQGVRNHSLLSKLS